MAQDAAEEERLRRVRHPVADRYRDQRGRVYDHRDLSNAALPSERARGGAADPQHLPAFRSQRSPDRDHRPRNAQARLLLPVPPRQSPVRARTGRDRTRVQRRVLQGGSNSHRGGLRRVGPQRLCRGVAAPQGARLGGGLARERACEAAGHYRTNSGAHAMSLRSVRQMALIATACIAVTSFATPVRAQMIVYDPSNYAQNVLQAARALQQINNQITSLQNQTQMLLNQAKHLASLRYSSLQAIEQSLARTQQLLNEAQRLAYDINQIDQAFQRLYPQGYTRATTSQQLVSDAKERWQNSLAAYQDALRVQAGVVVNLDTTRTETHALVSSSQSAVGALQAVQAGNQLVAVQTKQLADLTAVIASQSRAQDRGGARTNANQEQAREQLSRFLSATQSYQPQTVQMFH